MPDLWLHTNLDSTKRDKLLGEVRDGRLTAYLDKAHGDENYGAWLFLVDVYLRKTFGIGHDDLSDFTWHDEHLGGASPRDAAHGALENDDLGQMMLAAVR